MEGPGEPGCSLGSRAAAGPTRPPGPPSGTLTPQRRAWSHGKGLNSQRLRSRLSARPATSSGQHLCCAGAAAPARQLISTPEPPRPSSHSKPTLSSVGILTRPASWLRAACPASGFLKARAASVLPPQLCQGKHGGPSHPDAFPSRLPRPPSCLRCQDPCSCPCA